MKDKIKVFLGKLKAFFVRFGKKFKDNWLKVLCLLVAIFVCSCAWLSSCSRSRKDSTLQASADIIPTDYAFNIYPSVYPDIANDSRFTVDEDGTIRITGVFDTLFTANMPRFDIENNVSYYFYGKSSVNSVYIYAYINDNGVSTAYTDNVFSCTNVVNPAKFTLQVGRGTYDNLIIRPVFARSTVAVPWTPSINTLLDNSYNEGYTVGYNEGYTVGYNEGYNVGLGVYQYGVFFDSTVKTTVTTSSTVFDFTLPFDHALGSLSNVYRYLNDNYSSELSNITKLDISILPALDSINPNNIDIKVVTSFFSNYTDFTFNYNDITMTAGFLNPHVNTVSVDFEEGINNRRTFVWGSGEIHNDYYYDSFNYSRSYFVSFDLSISNYEYLQGIDIFSSYNAYNLAYDNGFNDGYDSGYRISQDTFQNQLQSQYDNGYQLGQEKGFNEGYSKGHTIGYNEGRDVTEQGYTFVSLIDAVGYGVTKPFVSLLNFDLLGVNLLSFATGLLTLVLMIKLVGIFI